MDATPPDPAPAGSFLVDAALYDRYVGRYGPALAAALLEVADVRPGERALDVGAGTGALTEALVDLLGAPAVAAVEPSPSFAAACRERHPGVDVRLSGAESLPFADAAFDVVLPQLVVNFLADVDAALAEARRVVRPGGRVAATVWDYAGGMTLTRAFWDAAAAIDESAAGQDEGRTMRLADPEALAALWRSWLDEVATGAVEVVARWDGFDDLWGALEGGVGPAGAWVASRSTAEAEALRAAFYVRLGSPTGGFAVPARAWWVRGVRPA